MDVVGCDDPNLTNMVITLLLYANDIVLLTGSHDDLDKQLKILHDYCSKMGMITDTTRLKS